MAVRSRTDWSRHVDQVQRSHHYTWLAEGLGGESPARAMIILMTNMRHLCDREGLDWDYIVEQSAVLYQQEEVAVSS